MIPKSSVTFARAAHVSLLLTAFQVNHFSPIVGPWGLGGADASLYSRGWHMPMPDQFVYWIGHNSQCLVQRRACDPVQANEIPIWNFASALRKKAYLLHWIAKLVECKSGAAEGNLCLPPAWDWSLCKRESDVRNWFLMPLFECLDPAMSEAPTLVHNISQYSPFLFSVLVFFFFFALAYLSWVFQLKKLNS